MTKKALPRPGAILGTGRPQAIRKPPGPRHQGLPFRWFYRPLSRYALAVLTLAALGMVWILGVVGCGPAQTSGYKAANAGISFPQARQSPLEIARHLRNAYYYKVMGRPDLALKELENAHQQNPDNLKLVNQLAQGYESQGHFETARKIYREALTRNGPNRALANNLCFTYYLEGRWQEAEVCFRQTLARDPGNEAARNNLGLLYCRLGRQDEARQLWQEAEGSTAATAKLHQALGVLGLSDGVVYAQAPKPAPPVAATPAMPAPVAAAPAVSPAKSSIPAKPLTPTQVAMQSASRPAPAPKPVKPLAKAKVAPPAPHQNAAAPAPAPVAPTPAKRAAAPGRPPYLTCAELVDTGIEIRNGTPRPRLAHEMRSLLSQEAFTVVKIGNHIDFGAPKTMIYYRPQAQRVARVLRTGMLPFASLEQTDRLHGKADIKVLLGHDILEDRAFMARLSGNEPPPTVVAKTPLRPKKSKSGTATAQSPTPVARAAQTAPREQTSPPGPLASRAPAGPSGTPPSKAELGNTPIEIRNGNGSPYLAHETRARLALKGFNIAKIGNHIDFGAKKTMIYFRPEGKRVAQALSRTFFPKAELEPSLTLRNHIAVKILLGADLLERPQLMARLNAKGQ